VLKASWVFCLYLVDYPCCNSQTTSSQPGTGGGTCCRCREERLKTSKYVLTD
jgi:hypothetical protein